MAHEIRRIRGEQSEAFHYEQKQEEFLEDLAALEDDLISSFTVDEKLHESKEAQNVLGQVLQHISKKFLELKNDITNLDLLRSFSADLTLGFEKIFKAAIRKKIIEEEVNLVHDMQTNEVLDHIEEVVSDWMKVLGNFSDDSVEYPKPDNMLLYENMAYINFFQRVNELMTALYVTENPKAHKYITPLIDSALVMMKDELLENKSVNMMELAKKVFNRLDRIFYKDPKTKTLRPMFIPETVEVLREAVLDFLNAVAQPEGRKH